MATVSEQLEAENRRRLLAMTPAERLAEALALGRAAVRAYSAAHGAAAIPAWRERSSSEPAGRGGRVNLVWKGKANLSH